MTVERLKQYPMKNYVVYLANGRVLHVRARGFFLRLHCTEFVVEKNGHVDWLARFNTDHVSVIAEAGAVHEEPEPFPTIRGN